MEVDMNQRAFLLSLLLIVVLGFGALIMYDAKTNNRLGIGKEVPASNWNWNDDWGCENHPNMEEGEEPEDPPIDERPEHQLIAKDYAEALALSGKYGMPVLVIFYADWCNWCQELDSETLTDKNVKEAMKKYVYVRVNSDNNREIAKKHGVKFLPYYTITNYKEEILKGDGGYKDAKPFIEWLDNPKLYKQPKQPIPHSPDQQPEEQQPEDEQPERRRWLRR
jgi:thiol-disulfide isomerase/thioredoxin